MADGTQHTYNQYVMQQNFSNGGFPRQVNNVERREFSIPHMVQENLPHSVHPTQVNNIDPSHINNHNAQGGAHTRNPYIVQQNHPHSMLPRQINNTGAHNFRTHSVETGTALYPDSANPNQYVSNALSTDVQTPVACQTSSGQRGTRPITAAQLWPFLNHFKSEKETAEKKYTSLQADCGTLQAQKEFYEKESNSWAASHNAIHTQAQRIQVYCHDLEKNYAALQKDNQDMVEQFNALQAAKVQIQRERDYYGKLSTHLFMVIMKAQKEQRPPSDAIVQQLYARGQARALHGRPVPTSQAQSQVQIAHPVSGAPEHSHDRAEIARAPLTPPASIRDAPTPPIVETKETNPSAASKKVVDLTHDGAKGIKRKSPDGGWDNSLRAPAKRVWEHLGKQKIDEKAQQKETDTIDKGLAECEEAKKKRACRTSTKKTSQKTTKNARVPAEKKTMAKKQNDKQPEQGDTTAEYEDLAAYEHELMALLDEDAAINEAKVSAELSETMTSPTPKGQSVTVSCPGGGACTVALEEGPTAVDAPMDKQMPSPAMSLFDEGEVPPFDDLFAEMEASSVQHE